MAPKKEDSDAASMPTGRRNAARIAVALLLLGPALGLSRIAPGLPAFYTYALGGFLCVFVGAWTIVSMVRGRGAGPWGGAALIGALGFSASLLANGEAPPTNDFTTDLASPPEFVDITRLPANAQRDMTYPSGFAAEQQKCCSDLAPLDLPEPPSRAIESAEDVARASGWEVVAVEPATGRLEAIETTTIFGFKDDIVIRIQAAGPSGSRIDVRSKSRDGRSDLGANAARIRAFLAALTAQTKSGS